MPTIYPLLRWEHLRRLKQITERAIGARIIRERWLPHGLDLAVDLRRRAPGIRVRTIFDVGANEGQSARAFARAFPSARILSFEPFAETHARLVANVRDLSQVECVHLALGATSGKACGAIAAESTNNSLVPIVSGEACGGEEITVETVDAVAEARGVEWIDLLKVDTEGYDLEVLKGAERMLREGRVLLIQVEAGMSPRNRKHAAFEVLKAHLEARDYLLFGLYDQRPEWTGEPRLRFVNAVYLPAAVADVRRSH